MGNDQFLRKNTNFFQLLPSDLNWSHKLRSLKETPKKVSGKNLFVYLAWTSQSFFQLVVSTRLKNWSQNGNLPQVGVKVNKYLKPPAGYFLLQAKGTRSSGWTRGCRCCAQAPGTGECTQGRADLIARKQSIKNMLQREFHWRSVVSSRFVYFSSFRIPICLIYLIYSTSPLSSPENNMVHGTSK